MLDTLDKLDHSILRELREDGRVTVTKLASRVGLSKTPCQVRMRRLEDQGYIVGYTALVDHKKLGDKHIAFVQVSLNDTKTKALEAFNASVRNIAEVEQCHMIAADFDYLLKVRTSDIDAYREVLGEKISNLPHVKQTSTFVVMEDVK
ncbi:MAG TPA: proline dehydrogenase transcriptional activator [Gammaproteobacteria bacterium]|jgi:Lrp/AsnC family leucine-responsive transcriptional regulator|nr:proline dehydrogenase transcriptional activator [Gammaproteobacteria bacterium]